jgi:hypothetical protein
MNMSRAVIREIYRDLRKQARTAAPFPNILIEDSSIPTLPAKYCAHGLIMKRPQKSARSSVRSTSEEKCG